MLEFTTEKFSGPLGLLLQLIEKEELDITEVGLAKIADQYTEYIHKSDNIDADEMADFLLIAAKLLYIKSKALLPYLYQDEDDEDIQELENQLRMYKEFIEASKNIEAMIGKKQFSFIRVFDKYSRKSALGNLKMFSAPQNATAQNLKEAYEHLLGRIAPLEEKLKEKKLEYKISIEDKIKHIREIILTKFKQNFSMIIKEAKNKTEVIVSFLAMLELVKQREVIAEQGDLFTDIIINKK